MLPAGSIAVILGTRPEIIKLAPLVRRLGEAAVLIHTGQHYDQQLSRVFLEQFGFCEPDLNLGVGGQTRGEQIGNTVAALDSYLADATVDAVVVQGDTNSALAGALAANANQLPIFHVEAGLRSFDRAMPEEHNRVLTDHLATRCFAPTATNVRNLANEGIDGERVIKTGNTIVEALRALVPAAEQVSQTLAELDLEQDGYVLATLHRPENVDDPRTLARCLKALQSIPLPVYFPAHPRTVNRIDRHELWQLASAIQLVEPVDYLTFLALQEGARLIVSDSGGIQEEVTILKRPLVVVRNSTERPESLEAFATLVRPQEDITAAVEEQLAATDDGLARLRTIPSPYGDGTAAERMLAGLTDYLEQRR